MSLQIVPFWFIFYKFLNAFFLGLSVGAIFTLYTPLPPSIYSLGGMFLAIGMLGLAQLYHAILNTQWFFRISLGVELILLLAMCYFIVYQYSYQSALLLYIGYQITFVFGSYLVRAETLLLHTNTLLKKVDTAKQLGYLMGMGVVYLFYKLLTLYGITQYETQVYLLHYLLIFIEIFIIGLIIKSFKVLPL